MRRFCLHVSFSKSVITPSISKHDFYYLFCQQVEVELGPHLLPLATCHACGLFMVLMGALLSSAVISRRAVWHQDLCCSVVVCMMSCVRPAHRADGRNSVSVWDILIVPNFCLNPNNSLCWTLNKVGSQELYCTLVNRLTWLRYKCLQWTLEANVTLSRSHALLEAT